MSFSVDKQTLDDLNILGKFKPDSMYNLFNKVHTSGGAKVLEQMFYNPLADEERINERSATFSYFQKLSFSFPLDGSQFNVMENYLDGGADGNLLLIGLNMTHKQLLELVIKDPQYQLIKSGIMSTITCLNMLSDFVSHLNKKELASPFAAKITRVKVFLDNHRLQELLDREGRKQLSLLNIIKYQYLLNHVFRPQLKMVMEFIHLLDVYIAVSGVAKLKGFNYAVALPKEKYVLKAKELSHPSLQKAVGNSIDLDQHNNVFFLTGANMAGKSTFMKSFGVAVYLAHMGFPVSVKEMAFSVKDGLHSSINVPDNLNMGYSHFYAEVLRVKKVAEDVSSTKALFVIFDELFKGTNVKDAYDATLAVTQAFADYRNCFFIISTHIVEVGEILRSTCSNMQFFYLPTVMDGMKPRYTYKFENGITRDRQGMLIIENEGILDILNRTLH